MNGKFEKEEKVMNEKVKEEVLKIIKDYGFKRSLKNFRNINSYYWNHISTHTDISEDFIREFQDKLDWDSISQYQNLSESFMEEFKHKLDWYLISTFQKMSKDFIIKFTDELEPLGLIQNKYIDKDLARKIKITINRNLLNGLDQN
jgi:hypothetical protein